LLEGCRCGEPHRERGWHYATIRRLFRSGSNKVRYSERGKKRVELYRQDVVVQMEADPDFGKIQEDAVKQSKAKARSRFVLSAGWRSRSSQGGFRVAILQEECQPEGRGTQDGGIGRRYHRRVPLP
jgi:hypothetical protein